MANPITTKLQKLSSQYSAKVKEARELEAKKKKPFVTDAEVKTINGQIATLKREYNAINAEYNKLAKLKKTAEEYLKLNTKLKDLEASIKKAEARGEDTTSYKQERNAATIRLNAISPDVEREFPEIKVAKPVVTTPTAAASGPTGTTATAPAQTQTAEPVGTKTKVITKNTTDADQIALAKKEAARTKALGKISSQGVVASDYAERNAGIAAADPVGDREAIALGAAAASDFALPETLFNNIPSLKALLEKFVSTPGMTMDAFRKELRNDLWFKQNSDEIKARYVQYYNFRDLQASGRAQGTTDYEMQIAKIEANLKKRAVEIGSAAANDPTALRKAAENLYITNRSEDTNFVDGFLAASIKTVAGKIGGQVTEGYSGEALSNYKLLVSAARDNGFQLSDIIPGGATEQQVLQGIATGSIDINRVIADARKLAAQGQPQYVRDLLAQGYTLKQVLAPYRQTMANVLEIQDPEEIGLNDPLLRSAITDKGDMNMYEFKKALRRDNRWQYTEQARADVSSATLGVLRDFGFQG